MGVALISAHVDFRLRIDPEEIQWKYKLNTFTEDTYGGKVVQILGITLDTLTLPVVSGVGGRVYLASVAKFFREMMIWQRDTGREAIFSYAPSGYRLKVYASSFQLADKLDNVLFPFQLTFKVQADLAGVVKESLIRKELESLKAGIGYVNNKFNDYAATQDANGVTPNPGNVPPGAGGR